jgi:hypothetical protein
MNKAIRERLDALDVKSIILTVTFLAVAIFLFFYYGDVRDLFREREKRLYTGQTTGQVISIEPIQRVTQSKWKGTRIFVDSYKVSYRYNANGVSYESTDIIPVSVENDELLKSLLAVKINATCSVKFDTQNPKKSLIYRPE